VAAVHLVLEEGSHLRGQKLGGAGVGGGGGGLGGGVGGLGGGVGNTLSERAVMGGLEDEGVEGTAAEAPPTAGTAPP
jgi:hypothetical protein